MELNPARNMRDNIKSSYRAISSKKKAWENVDQLLNGAEKPGDKQHRIKWETQYLLFISLYCWDQSPITPDPWYQNESLKQKNLTLSEGGSGYVALQQSKHPQVSGAWWTAHMSAEGDDHCDCMATLNYFEMKVVTKRGSWVLGKSKCHSYLQEVKIGSQILQAWQPDFSHREGDGRSNPGRHFQTH